MRPLRCPLTLAPRLRCALSLCAVHTGPVGRMRVLRAPVLTQPRVPIRRASLGRCLENSHVRVCNHTYTTAIRCFNHLHRASRCDQHAQQQQQQRQLSVRQRERRGTATWGQMGNGARSMLFCPLASPALARRSYVITHHTHVFDLIHRSIRFDVHESMESGHCECDVHAQCSRVGTGPELRRARP
jgi:hypothetical protein